MIYFVNYGFGVTKSGIEHAEAKRIHLFDQHHTPCTLVTSEWDPQLHDNTREYGIKDDQLLNLYDYYMGTRQVKAKHLDYKEIDLGRDNLNYGLDQNNHRYLVYKRDGKLAGRINFDPDEGDQVTSTELFDDSGNLYAVVMYDRRGFKSKTDWYSPDNKVERSEWCDLNGRVVLEEYNKVDPKDQKGKEMANNGYLLRDHRGKWLACHTFAELEVKFLNDVNGDGGNIFVLDRSLTGDEAMMRLKQPAFKVFHLHNSQAVDIQDEMHSVLNDNYEYSLWNIDHYDAVISSTKKQMRDVTNRFHPQHAHMYTIPVGIVPDAQFKVPRVPMAKRTPGKVIIVARIAEEKQMPRIVHSLGMIKKAVPDVTLDIWGYTNSEKEKDAIVKAAQQYGMDGSVNFCGYTTHLPKVYDSARIFALASTMEGFNLAIMEAISHGVVGVTYDTNYGPNEIIEDGVNGYVVPYDDEKAMANRIQELLTDDDKLQRFSDAAYDSAKRYSTTNVWRQWQRLIDDGHRALGED